jgi:hypothetical protein
MTTTAIREKLYDYIRIANDKKLKAIYWMLEDEITEKTEWWKDKEFTAELDKEFIAWKTGKAKGHTLSDLDNAIDALKQKRKTK